MQIVMKATLCLILVLGIFSQPIAYGQSVLLLDEACSAQTECSQCAKNSAQHPMHSEPAPATSSCCPSEPPAPVAVKADCICSHTPGMPYTNTAMAVPISIATQFVAIPVSTKFWGEDWLSNLASLHSSDLPENASLAQPGLFLQNMSFRI